MCQTRCGHLRTSDARYDKTIRSASDARIRAGYVGGVPVSGPVDWEGIRWRFWLWYPWGLLGGALFLTDGVAVPAFAPHDSKSTHPHDAVKVGAIPSESAEGRKKIAYAAWLDVSTMTVGLAARARRP